MANFTSNLQTQNAAHSSPLRRLHMVWLQTSILLDHPLHVKCWPSHPMQKHIGQPTRNTYDFSAMIGDFYFFWPSTSRHMVTLTSNLQNHKANHLTTTTTLCGISLDLYNIWPSTSHQIVNSHATDSVFYWHIHFTTKNWAP